MTKYKITLIGNSDYHLGEIVSETQLRAAIRSARIKGGVPPAGVAIDEPPPKPQNFVPPAELKNPFRGL